MRRRFPTNPRACWYPHESPISRKWLAKCSLRTVRDARKNFVGVVVETVVETVVDSAGTSAVGSAVVLVIGRDTGVRGWVGRILTMMRLSRNEAARCSRPPKCNGGDRTG